MSYRPEPGDFIRWHSEDDKGPFALDGQFQGFFMSKLNNPEGEEYICMLHMGETGPIEMSFPVTDGHCTKIRQPKVFGPDFVKPAPAPKKAPERRAQERKPKGGPTKVDLVIKLLQDDPPTSRKDAIEKIVAAGISTPAGASTFYNSAKKRL